MAQAKRDAKKEELRRLGRRIGPPGRRAKPRYEYLADAPHPRAEERSQLAGIRVPVHAAMGREPV